MTAKRPLVDLMALTADQATPMPEAVQRTAPPQAPQPPARPATVPEMPPPQPQAPERVKTANLEGLAFKVSPEFRKRFRQRAAAADLKLNELLFAALDAWEKQEGLRT